MRLGEGAAARRPCPSPGFTLARKAHTMTTERKSGDEMVYSGPEGRIFREKFYGGEQFRAVRSTPRGPKARRYDTQRGALGWLRRMQERAAK